MKKTKTKKLGDKRGAFYLSGRRGILTGESNFSNLSGIFLNHKEDVMVKCVFWTPETSGYSFCEIVGRPCSCKGSDDNCEPDAEEIKDNAVAVDMEAYQDKDSFHPNRNR